MKGRDAWNATLGVLGLLVVGWLFNLMLNLPAGGVEAIR
jgi:hypothetical protein